MALCYWSELDGEEWGFLLHAESRGKAKKSFVDWSPDPRIGYDHWTEIRVRRVKGLDDKPITFDSTQAADFHLVDENGEEDLDPDEFINFCRCDICRNTNKTL